MSVSDKIVDTVIGGFNLLTFLAATIELLAMCDAFYKGHVMVKGIGDLVFVALIYVVSVGIVWKTGQWLFAKRSEIYVPGLLAAWVYLVLIFPLVIIFGMGGPHLGR